MVKKGRVFSSHTLELMEDVTAKNQHGVAVCKASYLLKCVYFVEVGRIVFICFPITVATFHRPVIRTKVFSLQLYALSLETMNLSDSAEL